MDCMELYGLLYKSYGPQDWWPVRGFSKDAAYEVMVGAILTQNTAWRNVEYALETIGSKLSPEWVQKISTEELGTMIRPSGYYNQKARRLKTLTDWYAKYDYSPDIVQNTSPVRLKDELLSLNGIGPETCYSILLYAFNMPFFVIDAYTVRLCQRLPLFAEEHGYERLRSAFERETKKSVSLYKEYHALIVRHCASLCKKTPLCGACGFRKECLYCLQQSLNPSI